MQTFKKQIHSKTRFLWFCYCFVFCFVFLYQSMKLVTNIGHFQNCLTEVEPKGLFELKERMLTLRGGTLVLLFIYCTGCMHSLCLHV